MVMPAQKHGDAPSKDVKTGLLLLCHRQAPPSKTILSVTLSSVGSGW